MVHRGRRLGLLERAWGPTSPPGCRWVGDRCNAYPIVRVGPDDGSSAPEPPTTCATCGRPRFIRTYVLVAGDADPPIIPGTVA